MQSACYIMHGLSLSQRSFTPCCASPPTAPRRQADTDTHARTHPAPCVSSHILYSSTLTHAECTISNRHQMSERERQRGRPRVGGVGRLKVKDKERGNFDTKGYIHAEIMRLQVWVNSYMYLMCLRFFRTGCRQAVQRKLQHSVMFIV